MKVLLFLLAAWAQFMAYSPAYQGPGDIFSWAAWGGFRCYSNAYSGNVADVWDTATGNTTETLITCSPGGTLNQTIHALSVTCAVSCSVKELYDQSGANKCGGSACNWFGGAPPTNFAEWPVLQLNAINSSYCMSFNPSNSQLIKNTTVSFYQLQPYTMEAIALRTTGQGATFNFLWGNAGGGGGAAQLYYDTGNNQISATSGIDLVVSATDGVFHAINYVATGSTTSKLQIDGNITTGTNTGSGTWGTSGSPTDMDIGVDGFSNFMNGTICEVGVAAGDQSGNLAALNANQHAAYGSW